MSRCERNRSAFQWSESEPSAHERFSWMKFINILTYSRGMILRSMGLNHRDISKLGSIRHELSSDLFYLHNEQWITDNVTFKNEAFLLQALNINKFICIADVSFYPYGLHLINAALFTSNDGK